LHLILNFLIFVGKCAYTTLPGVFANTGPVLTKKLPFLNYPLDFGLTINGKPLLGPKKTFRGLISGIIFSMAVMYIQYFIYKFTNLKHMHLVDFETVNFHLLAFLMGFGVITGDAFESFIKRRLNIPPSKSFIPFDQIDCAVGGLLFGRIAWAYPWQYAAVTLVITFFIHVSGRHLAYYMGLCETKW